MRVCTPVASAPSHPTCSLACHPYLHIPAHARTCPPMPAHARHAVLLAASGASRWRAWHASDGVRSTDHAAPLTRAMCDSLLGSEWLGTLSLSFPHCLCPSHVVVVLPTLSLSFPRCVAPSPSYSLTTTIPLFHYSDYHHYHYHYHYHAYVYCLSMHRGRGLSAHQSQARGSEESNGNAEPEQKGPLCAGSRAAEQQGAVVVAFQRLASRASSRYAHQVVLARGQTSVCVCVCE